MSAKHSTYSLTAPNAVYANRALSHACWAAGATVFIMILSFISEDTQTLIAVWCLWMLLEIPQALVFGIRSVKAGRRDGRTLTLSIREGAFVSIPEDAAE
jgi:hypothetical protein